MISFNTDKKTPSQTARSNKYYSPNYENYACAAYALLLMRSDTKVVNTQTYLRVHEFLYQCEMLSRPKFLVCLLIICLQDDIRSSAIYITQGKSRETRARGCVFDLANPVFRALSINHLCQMLSIISQPRRSPLYRRSSQYDRLVGIPS